MYYPVNFITLLRIDRSSHILNHFYTSISHPPVADPIVSGISVLTATSHRLGSYPLRGNLEIRIFNLRVYPVDAYRTVTLSLRVRGSVVSFKIPGATRLQALTRRFLRDPG